MRKHIIANGECYHIFSRSIAQYKIFNDEDDYSRMVDLLKFYRFTDMECSYSYFLNRPQIIQKAIMARHEKNSPVLIDIIAYSLMPTHIHLILKQISDKGISIFMSNILNSYTRFFNIKHGRKGPLWEQRFQNRLIKGDYQMLHTTRYLHLNAVTAELVAKPEDWKFSSYQEYISPNISNNSFCKFQDLIDLKPQKYKKFAEDQISYQKGLAKIKYLLIDNYSG